jgi:hypothetical protein
VETACVLKEHRKRCTLLKLARIARNEQNAASAVKIERLVEVISEKVQHAALGARE